MINNKIVYNNENQIFNFISPNNNDKLSAMHGIDLQYLIVLINEYYIELRNKLGLDNNITFGIEIEVENAMKHQIAEELIEAFPEGDWITKNDHSLNDGIEINSPILRDTEKNWQDLDKVCSIVEPLAIIGPKSGGHIHVGAHSLGNNKTSWLNFIKLWSIYENIIYRFAYGSFLNARKSIEEYAYAVAESFWKDYIVFKDTNASFEAMIHKLSRIRYQAVNFSNVISTNCHTFQKDNTIEFRCPNGSLDAAVWQNNLKLFVKLLTYSKSKFFDDDIIDKRHKLNLDKYCHLKWYNEIYLEQALELCDMLFDNNLDKVYFLKQYLKSFQVGKYDNDYPIPYELTKKKK